MVRNSAPLILPSGVIAGTLKRNAVAAMIRSGRSETSARGAIATELTTPLSTGNSTNGPLASWRVASSRPKVSAAIRFFSAKVMADTTTQPAVGKQVPDHSAASPQTQENQKAKGKNQKAKISAPGRGPDRGGIFRGWPQSRQSSMTQFLSGAGNWPPRGIFAAREEMGL
jgi:hypothetical protein